MVLFLSKLSYHRTYRISWDYFLVIKPVTQWVDTSTGPQHWVIACFGAVLRANLHVARPIAQFTCQTDLLAITARLVQASRCIELSTTKWLIIQHPKKKNDFKFYKGEVTSLGLTAKLRFLVPISVIPNPALFSSNQKIIKLWEVRFKSIYKWVIK